LDQVGSTVFAYDANNNRTNVVEAGKTNVWTFDAYDRVQLTKMQMATDDAITVMTPAAT